MPAEPWFFAYGLLGLTQSGLLPVLMPLAAGPGGSAGLTYAAFSAAGIVAPFLGSWADHTGRHRDLLIWGMLLAGSLLLLFPFLDHAWRIPIAAGAGLGAMATTTAGNVLAIQGQVEAAWDTRVALLQRFISAGQVIGLVTAGVLARAHPTLGFTAAGGALLAAGILAIISAPKSGPRPAAEKPHPRPMVGGDAGVTGPHHRGHHPSWHAIGEWFSVINRPLRHFLLVWLVAYPAMNGFATLFPVAMTRQFGLSPEWPSTVYALGVGGSLFLYGPVGSVTHRVGGGRTLLTGIAGRLTLFALLAAAAFAQLPFVAWLALGGFALIQFVWPLLAVGANSLAVRLAPDARGESVGLFNAATSLAAAVGSALAGVIFGDIGFAGLAAVCCATVGAALLLAVRWRREWRIKVA